MNPVTSINKNKKVLEINSPLHIRDYFLLRFKIALFVITGIEITITCHGTVQKGEDNIGKIRTFSLLSVS